MAGTAFSTCRARMRTYREAVVPEVWPAILLQFCLRTFRRSTCVCNRKSYSCATNYKRDGHDLMLMRVGSVSCSCSCSDS